MRLLVVGAAGRTGRELVGQALGHGHDVTALVHDRPLAISHPRLEIAHGDARVFDDVAHAAEGHSAVALAVAAGRGGHPDLHETAAANVVHAMAITGATRLAVLSASGAFNRTNPRLSLAARTMIATALKGTYDDLEAMERRVMASDLDWAIVRPVGLSDGAATGHYRVTLDGSIPPKTKRISRADVAAVMLKALETDTYRRRAVVVAG